jgi:putative ABC transport system ATP-binding protein
VPANCGCEAPLPGGCLPGGQIDTPDPSGQSILALLRELNDQGATIVIITHDHAIASGLSRRISMLDGQVTADTSRPALAGQR